MNGLDLVRKSPRRARRIAIGSDLRARGIARQFSEQKAVEQAAAVHARWLASRATAGVPDLAHERALRMAAEAEVNGRRLLAELHELVRQEREDAGAAKRDEREREREQV